MSRELSRFLLNRAIAGVASWQGAGALVQAYRDNADLPHDAARLQQLLRHETGKSFVAGLVSNLGGVLTLPLAMPAGQLANWLLQARLAASIAQLRGHSLEDPWVRAQVLASLGGAAAPALLRQASVGAAQWATGRLLSKPGSSVLQRVGDRIGAHLVQQAARRGLGRAVRLVPLAGAAIGGGFDAYATRRVAAAALRLFAPQRLLAAKKS
jgi:hypothetical protein